MAHGPSLPQARGSNTDDTQHHQHNHRRLHSTHIGPRHHHHHSGDKDPETNHIRSHDKQQQQQQQDQPQKRDLFDLAANLVTEVVQTVSVVQVVDGSGSLIEIKTYVPDSSDAGLAVAGSPDPTETTAAVPSNDDALPSGTAADVSAVSTLPPSSSDSGTLTSAPSSTSTSFPSLSGVFNSTSRPSFTNSTSLHSLFVNITTASTHSNTSFPFSITATSSSSSTLLTSTSEVPTLTVFGNVDGTGAVGGAGVDGAGATLTVLPTSTSTGSSSSGGAPLDPRTSSIVGGVVGSFAGIALVALAVMIALRWKRRQGQPIQLLAEGDGPDNGRMSMFSREGPGGGVPGGGGRGGSWAIPAALASLTGYKRASQATIQLPVETSERGFYRVSGRKLTSVLQSGGDGYGEPSSSDMRASTISGGSASFYRPDSIAMFSDPQSPPLQLGSPMRPESGIITMRSGPARTPVQEQGPMFDDTGPLTPPVSAADRDPLGRSLVGQSGSGVSTGSPSRFTERIT